MRRSFRREAGSRSAGLWAAMMEGLLPGLIAARRLGLREGERGGGGGEGGRGGRAGGREGRGEGSKGAVATFYSGEGLPRQLARALRSMRRSFKPAEVVGPFFVLPLPFYERVLQAGCHSLRRMLVSGGTRQEDHHGHAAGRLHGRGAGALLPRVARTRQLPPGLPQGDVGRLVRAGFHLLPKVGLSPGALLLGKSTTPWFNSFGGGQKVEPWLRAAPPPPSPPYLLRSSQGGLQAVSGRPETRQMFEVERPRARVSGCFQQSPREFRTLAVLSGCNACMYFLPPFSVLSRVSEARGR